MILGFGSTEREAASRVLSEIDDALQSGLGEEGIKEIQRRHSEEADRNKKLSSADAPERYSEFWASHDEVHSELSYTHVRFLHYNRRHPFSPDGWAAMRSEWVLMRNWEGSKMFELASTVTEAS